jgi:hypothetical protein
MTAGPSPAPDYLTYVNAFEPPWVYLVSWRYNRWRGSAGYEGNTEAVMTPIRWLLVLALLAVVPTPASSQGCGPSDASRVQDVQARQRRAAAVKYLEGVHVAQLRAQDQNGRFASLHELRNLPALPVGFVPKLLADQYSYVVSIKDLFDSCGFALFIDDHGVVYVGQPWATAGADGSGDNGNPPTVLSATEN